MRPVAEYGSVLMMGVSSSQLSKLDCVQHFAEILCLLQFTPLHSHRNATAIGLICKLLDGNYREQLQKFCLVYLSSTLQLQRSQRLNTPQPFLLASSITATSLDLFHGSFIGCASELWNDTQLDDLRSTVEH